MENADFSAVGDLKGTSTLIIRGSLITIRSNHEPGFIPALLFCTYGISGKE